jgi:hypothetical protein
MSNPTPTLPGERRQRKLDDLFGDDPFLSATMKARRLYEGVSATPSEELDARGAAFRPGSALLDSFPEISEEDASALWRLRRETERLDDNVEPSGAPSEHALDNAVRPTLLRLVDTGGLPGVERTILHAPADSADSAGSAPSPLALGQAAALLRGEWSAADASGRLSHLRTDVLLRWLKSLPGRETEGAVEEF